MLGFASFIVCGVKFSELSLDSLPSELIIINFAVSTSSVPTRLLNCKVYLKSGDLNEWISSLSGELTDSFSFSAVFRNSL